MSSNFYDFFVANKSVDVPSSSSNLLFPSMTTQGDAFCDFFSQGSSSANNENDEELPLFRSSFARISSSTGKVMKNPNLNSQDDTFPYLGSHSGLLQPGAGLHEKGLPLRPQEVDLGMPPFIHLD
jgi:hypothetical protein